MSNCVKKIAEAVVGLAIAIGAGVAWHVWHIDGFMACLLALGGLGLVGHAFEYSY